MNQNAKIYVSGHSGMLGSAMMRRLVADGYTNIITRTHSELDLTRQADVEQFFERERPEYVFHIAAKTGGIVLQNKYPTENLNDGSYITLNVLDAAHKYGAKGVVYVSSAKAYPENSLQPMTEDMLMSGQLGFAWTGYGLSKILGIKYCESVSRQFGKHFISVILPSIYGLNDFGTTVTPMLMSKFADAVVHQKAVVEIWGTGKARREFIYSEDAADALLFLMEHGKGGEYYNAGVGKEHSIGELAKIIREISGFNGKLFFDITKPESEARQFLDSSKLYRLGWKPKTAFRDGLQTVYLEHLNYVRDIEKISF